MKSTQDHKKIRDRIQELDDNHNVQAMAMTALVDMIERIDTLLLEACHLQTNIISLLNHPIFYRVLRVEEEFLWGKDWELHFKIKNFNVDLQLDEWMWFYPDLEHIERKFSEEAELQFIAVGERACKLWEEGVETLTHQERGELRRLDRGILAWLMRKEIFRAVESGAWGAGHRHYYRNLVSIQILKKYMFRDKLVLAQYAFHLFSGTMPPGHSNQPTIARFMLLRRAVVARLRFQVSRIGDHIAQFSKKQDMMFLQSHSRLGLERRKDHAAYSAYLSDRCEENWFVISDVLKELGEVDRNVHVMPRFIHRWDHHHTSRWAEHDARKHDGEFEPDVSEEGRGEHSEESRAFRSVFAGNHDKITFKIRMTEHVFYIKTSFWMPDRPDLQSSSLAHELGHIALVEHMGDLSHMGDLTGNGPLKHLVRELFHCLSTFKLNGYSASPHPLVYSVREIMADLLGSAVKGGAYALTTFNELSCAGLEELFRSPRGYYDLNRLDSLFISRAQPVGEFDWYYRLVIVCQWLRAITPAETLWWGQEAMIDGILGVGRQLLFTLEYIAVSENDFKMEYWSQLADRLGKIVSQSEAAKVVKKWREKQVRSHRKKQKSGHSEPVGQPGRGVDAPSKASDSFYFPRSFNNQPLSHNLRYFLVKNIVLRKNMLHNTDLIEISNADDLTKALSMGNHWKTIYGLDDKDGNISRQGRFVFFQYLHDIPYQCFTLEGRELAHRVREHRAGNLSSNGRGMDNLFLDISFNSDLGREYYYTAMDFLRVNSSSYSVQRLRNMARIMIDVYKTFESMYKKMNGDILVPVNFQQKDLEIYDTIKKNLNGVAEKNRTSAQSKVAIDVNDYELLKNTIGLILYSMVRWVVHPSKVIEKVDLYSIEMQNESHRYTQFRPFLQDLVDRPWKRITKAHPGCEKWCEDGFSSKKSSGCMFCREAYTEVFKVYQRGKNGEKSLGVNAHQLLNEYRQHAPMTRARQILVHFMGDYTKFLQGFIEEILGFKDIWDAIHSGNNFKVIHEKLNFEWDQKRFDTLFQSMSHPWPALNSSENKSDAENKNVDILNQYVTLSWLVLTNNQSKNTHPEYFGYPSGENNIQAQILGHPLEANHVLDQPSRFAGLYDSASRKVMSKRWNHAMTRKFQNLGPNPDEQHLYSMFLPLLGRNDILHVAPTRHLCKNHLPVIDPNFCLGGESERRVCERFPVFYLRRELALPLWFNRGDGKDASSGKSTSRKLGFSQPLALMLITLIKSKYRLEFASYMLQSANPKLTFKDEDVLFLTDGAEDILVWFSGSASLTRLIQIHDIQREIYEDFRVNRTELVLTPECLKVFKPKCPSDHDGVGANSGWEAFHLSADIRLQQDDRLQQVPQTFEKSFWDVFKPGQVDCELSASPGVTDYNAQFRRIGGGHGEDNPVWQKLMDGMGKLRVERLNTKLTRIIPKPEEA